MTANKQIKLSPIELELMDIFQQNPHTEISTLDMRQRGILHPANAISSLRKKGALFEKRVKDHKPLFRRHYKRIAHFKFMGFHHD